MQRAIHHLLSIKAIEPVPMDQRGTGVYSVFFTVPKKNGDWRSILDLKYVNQFIRLRNFHMESLKSILDALQPGEFMTSLDLTEAYLHVPILPAHRRFLRFCVGGVHLQFRALPFGLSTAPRVFTKLLVNPIAYLRKKGLHLHPYLDNLLIQSSSYQQAIQDTQTVKECFQHHGFLLNLEKSELHPTTKIQHLGMILDTQQMKVFLSPSRIKKTKDLAQSFRHRRSANLMPLTRLLGLMVVDMEVLQWGWLHTRELQWCLSPYQRLIATKIDWNFQLPP